MLGAPGGGKHRLEGTLLPAVGSSTRSGQAPGQSSAVLPSSKASFLTVYYSTAGCATFHSLISASGVTSLSLELRCGTGSQTACQPWRWGGQEGDRSFLSDLALSVEDACIPQRLGPGLSLL